MWSINNAGNDTLTLSPIGSWTSGPERDLTVDAEHATPFVLSKTHQRETLPEHEPSLDQLVIGCEGGA